MNRHCLCFISALTLTAGLFAQDPKVQLPKLSPTVTLKQNVGLTDIDLVYSRPGVKGREIFGKMIPFGSVWRTGANESTKITFSTPVKLNGTEIPAGAYALYTIPGEHEWTIIVYKDTSLWGAYGYDQKNDLVRIPATAVKLADPVETFTIDINDIRTESATLNLIWEKTRVPVKLEFEAINKALAQIEAALATAGQKSGGFYYNALEFCIMNGVALQKAVAWADQGIAQNPKSGWVIYEKACLLAKLGDKPGAIAAAKLSCAADPSDDGLAKTNEALIASLNK
jgi:hypothetical protein